MNQELYPIYQIKFPTSVDFQSITKISSLFHLRVYWEKYLPRDKATQCYRCQIYGHGQINCNRPPKCFKCAGSHLSSNCSRSRDMPPKCINCGKDHVASHKSCSAYKHYIGKFNHPPKTYEPPPPISDPVSFPRLPSRNYIPSPTFGKRFYWNTQPPPSHQPTFLSPTSSPQSPPIPNSNSHVPQNSYFDTLNEFQELQNTLSQINQICNIKDMLSKAKALLSNLKNAKNDTDKFLAFNSILSP